MSWLACGAAISTVLAWLLARPPGGWVLRVRLGCTITGREKSQRPRGSSGRVAVAVAVAGVAVATSRLSYVIVALTVVGATLFVLRQTRIARTRSASLRTRAQTIAALDLLAAELRAGILPRQAIETLADDAPSLRAAGAAAARGGDVVAALRAASAGPGRGPWPIWPVPGTSPSAQEPRWPTCSTGWPRRCAMTRRSTGRCRRRRLQRGPPAV